MNDSLLAPKLSCPNNAAKGSSNESFSQVITNDRHCQYHIIFVPKYRFKVLVGEVAKEVEQCIRAFTEQQGGEIIELKVQIDHVHVLVMVPPKVSLSSFVGTIKGRTAIRVFNKFCNLKNKPYWGRANARNFL